MPIDTSCSRMLVASWKETADISKRYSQEVNQAVRLLAEVRHRTACLPEDRRQHASQRPTESTERRSSANELPPLPAAALLEMDDAAGTISAALSLSPALVSNARRAEAVELDLRAARNLLLPRLDVSAFVSGDFYGL